MATTAPSGAGAVPAQAPSPAEALAHLVYLFRISRAAQVAAKLGLAGLMRDGPRAPADLAAETGTDPNALRRLLRALAGFGVFAEDAAGRFGLTSLAEPLRSDAPGGSLRDFAILLGEPESWRAWGALEHSVRTGRPAFEHVFGRPLFDYLAANPEPARLFDAAMASRSAQEAATFVAAYDLSDLEGTVVDVGGGRGTLLAAVLRANPALGGVLFDLPHVAEAAREALAAAGLAARCRIETGDFFERVPAGGAVYLLHRVIHDWDDARAGRILAHCRAAMPPRGGRLLLLEAVVPPGNTPHMAKLLDLLMLVWPGGRERDEAEYRALLAAAGFALAQIVPTASPAVSVIEAVPA
jgi:hypothetical protein